MFLSFFYFKENVDKQPYLTNFADSYLSELSNGENILKVKSKFILKDELIFFLIKDNDYSIERFLKPSLTQSSLNFKNLYWDQKDEKVNLILKWFRVHYFK